MYIFFLKRGLLVGLLTEQILLKMSHFNKIALKSTPFRNVYFVSNICQEIDQAILSYIL